MLFFVWWKQIIVCIFTKTKTNIMTDLINIKETFAKGTQNAKIELGRITYWFNLNELRINQSLDGFPSNRAPLYYDNEAKFYAAVKRVLNKQK